MKAIRYASYGEPEQLNLVEAAPPQPSELEVLVRVVAASANPLDWRLLGGAPWLMRRLFHLQKPTPEEPASAGADLAGVITAVGSQVTRFQPGDEVFGTCKGSFAEFACAEEKNLALKPAEISFEQAAALPIAAVTALQGLRDHGKLQPTEKVLINGAAGGVGHCAVQIAKAMGAEVTAVCSTRNVEFVRTLGADVVIDYTRQDFARLGQRWNLFLDCHASHSLTACRRVLLPGGRYIAVGGPVDTGPLAFGRMFTVLLIAALFTRFDNRRLALFIAKIKPEDLTFLAGMMQAGKLRMEIEQTCSLPETAAALRHLKDGHVRGKLIVAP
jgi:NADPH:quinone reductase-like Zn-dependent oxidoreductase